VRLRRGFLVSGLLASALALGGAASASAKNEHAVRLWSHAIRGKHLPGVGCFRSSYPTVQWKKVRCAPRPPAGFHEDPPRGSGAQGLFGALPRVSSAGSDGQVGGGHGGIFSAEVPTGTIASAVGSIPSVSAGSTEEDEGTAENFSLQLNSQFFPGATECGAVVGCEGWEQFVYSSTSSIASLSNVAFMEFWLINFLPGGGSCASLDTAGRTWETFENDCDLKSELVTLSGGPLKVSGLTGTTFEGKANSGGLDSVVMTTAGGNAVATGAPNILHLDKAWKIAEFGVIGNFNGSEAVFSPNTTITVNTAVRSSNSSDVAPNCVNTSFTAESNNLTAEESPALSAQPFPTVSSRQTNGTATLPATCATFGIGPPSATLSTPPNGAVYGYGQAVDANYSCEAAAGATLKSCTGTVPNGAPINTTTLGSNTFEVTAEDTDGQKETVTHTYTVNKAETTLTYKGALTSDYHDAFTASATLVNANAGDAPIEGKTVKFTLGVGDSCSATTDVHGNAECSITPHQTGTQTLVAEFAGDTTYLASSAKESFAITPEETTMTYTGPSVILAGASGATLTAKMVEDGSSDNDGDGGSPGPAPSETVTLALGTQSCTGTTDSSGNVHCTIPSVTVPLGPELVGAMFSGDASYGPSVASKPAIVFAFPSRGAFTLGDKTVAAATETTTVTWWGDTWSSLNSLSGGSAPPAGKGFAGTVSLPTTTPPTTCGASWTTSGGNSPPPVGSIPSYMGTLVTSKVTKSGSVISGNTVEIVIVKTNPGYAPNPSAHGSGVVVAKYC
jgi:hypothetical protein